MTLAKQQGTAFRGGVALVVAGVSLLAAFAVVLSFLWPPAERPINHLNVGSVEDIERGSILTISSGTNDRAWVVYLVRPAAGPPHALLARSPRGCSVPWRPGINLEGVEGWFKDPCQTRHYDPAGNCHGPNCEGHLDRARLDVRADGEMILYPDQILKAPEQGWPPEGAAKP